MRIFPLLFVLLSLVSCNSGYVTKEIECIYSNYRYFRLKQDKFDISSISYTRQVFDKSVDSVLLLTMIEDSIYFPLYDTTQLGVYNRDIKIKLNKEDLLKSTAKIGNKKYYGNFKLTLMKKHRIKEREYMIYRFDHFFDGDDGRNSFFYTEEFGVIVMFDYDRGGLTMMTEIVGNDNKDYLKLSENMLDDTVFLYTSKEHLIFDN